MPIFMLIGLALPLMELAVLVKVGQAVGLWRLLLLLLGMAVLGAALLYWQGWTALRQTQDALMRGEPPVGPMLEGMLLVAAGVLLLVPGLITDVFALALLVPPLRRAIARGTAETGGRDRRHSRQGIVPRRWLARRCRRGCGTRDRGRIRAHRRAAGQPSAALREGWPSAVSRRARAGSLRIELP